MKINRDIAISIGIALVPSLIIAAIAYGFTESPPDDIYLSLVGTARQVKEINCNRDKSSQKCLEATANLNEYYENPPKDVPALVFSWLFAFPLSMCTISWFNYYQRIKNQ